eukprot:TRINITY_DN6854_c0_g1_i3.p1 TRINITY_DN6854_c0_g1~~TRINITY_DN6854_c0_g1_i3.p1  ORF type:complete len:691 (-),score=87.28 TRINITY_DN6854_c0_g1_i3:253-2325(-)
MQCAQVAEGLTPTPSKDFQVASEVRVDKVSSFSINDFQVDEDSEYEEEEVFSTTYDRSSSSTDPDLLDYDRTDSDAVEVGMEQYQTVVESPECSEVIFVKEGVAIYRSRMDKIVGNLTILKQQQVLYISWFPLNRTPVPGETDVISTPRGKDRTLYAVHPVPLSDIKAIRKYMPSFGQHYICLVLVSGLTLPPFYFINGGIKSLIKTLKQYVTLVKSQEDPNTYVLHEMPDPLVHGLDLVALGSVKTEVETWDQTQQNFSSRLWTQFSKSIRRVQDSTANFLASIDQVLKEEIEDEVTTVRKLSAAAKHTNSWTSLELEFELLDDIPEILTNGRQASFKLSPPLSKDSFTALFDEYGQLNQWDTFLTLVHAGGIDMEIRQTVWKYLLGVYPRESTCEQREHIDKQMVREYKILRKQWRSICNSDQELRFGKFRERRIQIEKDVRRTDRHHPFYGVQGQDWRSNEQLVMLYNVLMAYVMYNFDLGYIQGMSDLASPMLYAVYKGYEWNGLPQSVDRKTRLRIEAEAFWMFSALMWRVESHFDKDQRGVMLQLEVIQHLTCKLDPQLHSHLTNKGCGDLLQCFRWLFVLFKREFKFEEVMHLWEVIWSCQRSEHFQLYVCMSLLLLNRNQILEQVEDVTDFLDMCNHVDADMSQVLREAKRLCEFVERIEKGKTAENLAKVFSVTPPFSWCK